jgi:hypothetical protein
MSEEEKEDEGEERRNQNTSEKNKQTQQTPQTSAGVVLCSRVNPSRPEPSKAYTHARMLHAGVDVRLA